MASELLVEQQGPTLVLTLSDPATRNTLSPAVYTTGMAALRRAHTSSDIRCVVLQGAGDQFCSGGNLQRITGVRAQGDEAGRVEQSASVDAFGRLVQAIQQCAKPVIAAVEGFAAGGGCSLALACDLVVAAEDARFVMSYARIGLSPDGGGSWALARALPRGEALKALWLAETLPAPRLHSLGLVQELCTKGQALSTAMALADRLSRMAPNAVAAVKRLVNDANQATLPEQLAAERDAFVDNVFHANGGEGLAAFLEKRAPQFK